MKNVSEILSKMEKEIELLGMIKYHEENMIVKRKTSTLDQMLLLEAFIGWIEDKEPPKTQEKG